METYQMKKAFLFFLFCCVTIIAEAADAPRYLAVWLKNGQRVDLLLSEKPNVKFSEGILRFEASGTAVEYAAADVKEFTLEAVSTGIKGLAAEDKDYVVSQSGNMLSISGAEPYAKVHLYSTDGTLVSTCATAGNGTASISLAPLTQGIYILKIASTTIKILRK